MYYICNAPTPNSKSHKATMPIRTIFSMDIDNWTTDKKPQSDLANSYSSGGQPPSLGDVRQMVVSEPSGSNQMYSNGQLPSVNDVCRREQSQSEVSCNRYDGPDENEVQQQVISELNDPGERTEDILSRFSSQFSVPPMVSKSFDSAINDGVLAPQPPPLKQIQRIGTSVIKVFKSGEIERLVDISAYSGYDDLKQDIARIFGIEGQLEDHGWGLFYADHEEDMLLVGDDPWQEFADCVRYIKILSPQEVQTRLDRDFAIKSALSQLEYQLGLQQ